MVLIGSAALAAFLTEAEKALIEAAEQEAKDLGKSFLPGLIVRLELAETNLGSPNFWQFRKEAEKGLEQTAIDIAKAALAWCNEPVTPVAAPAI